MRARLLLLLVVACFGLAGCGAVDDAKREADKQIERVKDKAREIKADLERLRDRVEKKVNETLAKIEGVLPRADENTRVPTRALSTSFNDFLADVHTNVEDYWVTTLTENDLPRPRVDRVFVDQGDRISTACGEDADDYAAFYCPADDTIYVGRRLAQDVVDGTGDFGAAYIIAHEYAHNVQAELGWFDEGPAVTTVAPFELQADCMAGAWGWAVYQQGRLQPGDVEEAVQTALAVGDFDFTNPQHHGTPNQRRDAWLRGYSTGDPSVCREFTQT